MADKITIILGGMKMKKVLSVVLALSMLLALGCAAFAENVIKIGVFEPSTGDSASGGKKEILGMQFANSETPTVEIGGEEYAVELVMADNGYRLRIFSL